MDILEIKDTKKLIVDDIKDLQTLTNTLYSQTRGGKINLNEDNEDVISTLVQYQSILKELNYAINSLYNSVVNK